MNWIATFYSHFGAVRYKQMCSLAGIPARLSPVPRDLSSSCGTCVRYTAEEPLMDPVHLDELEQIVQLQETCYRVHYRAENS